MARYVALHFSMAEQRGGGSKLLLQNYGLLSTQLGSFATGAHNDNMCSVESVAEDSNINDRTHAVSLERDGMLAECSNPSSPERAVSQSECRCQKRDDNIRVNLRGVTFVLHKMSLCSRSPASKLANLTKIDDSYDACSGEYYFDRNPTVFNSVLDYYSSGEMHLASNICIQAFRKELDFWKLEPELLAACCWSKYRKAEEEEKTLARVQDEWGVFNADPGSQFTQKMGTLLKIWVFMNEPQSSSAAKVSPL